MRTVILFAPVKILLQHSECEWLDVLGMNCLIYSDIDGANLLFERFPVLSTSFRLYKDFNGSPIVELDALAAAKKLEDPIVIALAESDLLRVARIKDRLHDSFTDYEAATLYCRDKFLMKQRLAEHGVRINPMSVVRSACDISDFVEKYGYPVVIKPRDGRGSGGVRLVSNNDDLIRYLRNQSESYFHNLMVEKYIDVPMLNVNGLYIEGRPIIISPVRSTVTCLDFLEGRSLGFQMLAESNRLHGKCIELTRRVIEQALPRQGTMLFHLELFLSDEDLIVCEIACRLGGCSVNQELIEAYGINPRFTLIDAERGGPSLLLKKLVKPLRLVGQLNIPPSNGKIIRFPDSIDLPFVRYSLITAVKGEHYSGMKLTNGEVVSAIVEGDSEAAVNSNLERLDSWVRSESVWE